MGRLVIEYSDALRYKEQTHWDENSDHLMVRNARYGWVKRLMAKASRRNATIIIVEQQEEIV